MRCRRVFATSLCIFAGVIANASSVAQVTTPFALRVVREQGWAEIMNKEDCLSGTLYVVDANRLMTDRPGRFIGYVMELPDRSNLNSISAVPVGTYAAFARLSETNGAVIELRNVPNRTNVQFHTGNEISDTEGCFILGATPVTSTQIDRASIVASRNNKCWIADSRSAQNTLLAEYGWTDLTSKPPNREIYVIVE